MSAMPVIRQFAERHIRRACRRLPEDVRDERYEEWVAELLAILADPAGGRALLRGARAVSYAVGISRATQRLRRMSGGPGGHRRHAPAVRWQDGAPPATPRGPAFRASVGVVVWLVVVMVVVALIRGLQPHGIWPMVPGILAAAGFVAFCLVDLARAADVQYLPKWAWALACLLSVPLGGIMYLSVGRPPRAHSALRRRLLHRR